MEAYPVNAVTGREYRYKIGTGESRLLYKVVDSTGEISSKGYRLTRREPRNPNPNHLYYDDPQQFANHSGLWVDPEFVKQWLKDRRAAVSDDNTNNEYDFYKPESGVVVVADEN